MKWWLLVVLGLLAGCTVVSWDCHPTVDHLGSVILQPTTGVENVCVGFECELKFF